MELEKGVYIDVGLLYLCVIVNLEFMFQVIVLVAAQRLTLLGIISNMEKLKELFNWKRFLLKV